MVLAKPISADSVFSENLLLVARHPAKYFGLAAQFLHEVVDVEIDRDVRLAFARINRRPGDVGNAMMLVNRRNANIPYSHLLRADRSIVSIALFHNLLELIVILPTMTPAGDAAMKAEA
ncbi:hypothetical protein IHQ72_18590 [Mesorhizobium onobrychidis]|uniref:Uncharacterized protein n=1 Tax=Mesorhizobium onobrychidis TaxID=2775404 RepID=A0ABY5QNQ4_9HYPH|nr:hypothetical protein IHQ72_18590 [Mesorhizobium onobrychidis]